jgi:regulator of protease activity HflC (stomatin/prohibitin superfamily)
MGTFVIMILTILALTGVTILLKGIRVVSQNETWIIERLGKFSRPIVGGLNLLVPFVDRVAYKWDMREQAMPVPQQDATTKDNIRVAIDGVLYIQITDARRASYGSTNPYNSVVELAQTTMRAQIGRMDLDETLSKRDAINGAVVTEVNEAATPWGVLIKRYEINDIVPPLDMQEDMKRQAKAERERRELETSAIADRAARITRAEGKKKEAELLSEGDRIKVENEARANAMSVEAAAQADATSRRLRAEAEAEALRVVGKIASTKEGHIAVTFHLAQEAIAAQAKIANESTILLKDGANGAGQAANTVAEAMAVAALVGQRIT